jgi:hypothetical protein
MRPEAYSIGDLISDLSDLPEFKRKALVTGLLESLSEEAQAEVVSEWGGITPEELRKAANPYHGQFYECVDDGSGTLTDKQPGFEVELPTDHPTFQLTWLHIAIALGTAALLTYVYFANHPQ